MISLLVFLLTGLSTSSFFLSNYLTKIITKNEHDTRQLNFAIEQENLAALKFAWEKSSLHDEQWLKLAKIIAKTQGQAAYQLGDYYQDKPAKAIFWYKSAIRLNYLAASTALAQLYFQQGKLIKAAAVLDVLPVEIFERLSVEAIVLKVNIAINQGEIADVQKIVSDYIQQLKISESGRLLLDDIKKYQVYVNDNQVVESSQIAMSCDNSIQLFATNLNNLKHLENLIIDFKKQPLNNAICFSPVRYMAIDSLDCTNEKNISIQCNEINWQHWADTVNTRYVGVMLPQGGANVHFGALYFDEKDNVDVLAHEISHLLGFVDEYPLVKEHIKCQTIQKKIFSQNISVLKNTYQGSRKAIRANVLTQLAWAKHINKSTPILQLVTGLAGEQFWQLGTPEAFKHEVGVFKSPTCDNSTEQLNVDFSAFKPVYGRTKLQYFALSFPPLYSAQVQENSTQYLMPSFHYNIALAYFQKDPLQKKNIEQANYWLEQAINWESDIDRRNKVRQGEF